MNNVNNNRMKSFINDQAINLNDNQLDDKSDQSFDL